MSYSRLRLLRSLNESRRTQEMRLALSRRSCSDARPWNIPAGSSVIRFPYKILFNRKIVKLTWMKYKAYSASKNRQTVSGAFSKDSPERNQTRRHFNPKGMQGAKEGKKLTVTWGISVHERRRQRWSWSGCCSNRYNASIQRKAIQEKER